MFHLTAAPPGAQQVALYPRERAEVLVAHLDELHVEAHRACARDSGPPPGMYFRQVCHQVLRGPQSGMDLAFSIYFAFRFQSGV
jgi:hypothetical protein